MKICVLQASYEGSSCDYQHYDPPRILSHLLPGHEFHHEFLKKVSTFRQIKALARQGFDIYVNLCEGYLDSDVPSIDVILALEQLNLPFTGPTSVLYDPPKDLMKLVARSSGVQVPAFAVVESIEEAVAATARLPFPLFVKPAAYGDSMGIDDQARVTTTEELTRQVEKLLPDYGRLLIEEYIDGREFTVLLYGRPEAGSPPVALTPLEFIFPPGSHFKTYDLKITQFHPECNVPCEEPALATQLREAAAQVFTGFAGEGFARVDFRVTADGRIYFLEVNFTCSVFYPEGYQGSADYILAFNGMGQPEFLRALIDEGLARHARRQRPWTVGATGDTFGIFAARPLAKGAVVFAGEGQPQRIITRAHVERTWSENDREVFYRYAYPTSAEVFVLWDQQPSGWAPQNHSCEPNTAFEGLDVVARRDIPAGEELTVDYATFYDACMTPFDCTCDSPKCRGRITGGKGLFPQR
jgi:D-alanine-D-alanine ligase